MCPNLLKSKRNISICKDVTFKKNSSKKNRQVDFKRLKIVWKNRKGGLDRRNTVKHSD